MTLQTWLGECKLICFEIILGEILGEVAVAFHCTEYCKIAGR